MSPGFQKPSVAGRKGRLGKVVAPKAKKPKVKGVKARKVKAHKPGKPNTDAFQLKWNGGHAKGKSKHSRLG